MKVGFIGLGKMGTGMARNLAAAGHELTVYNRTREKAKALADAGARVAGNPDEAVRGSRCRLHDAGGRPRRFRNGRAVYRSSGSTKHPYWIQHDQCGTRETPRSGSREGWTAVHLRSGVRAAGCGGEEEVWLWPPREHPRLWSGLRRY